MAIRLVVTAGLLLLEASQAWAQAPTVQLPTFSFFSVATTVSVPDRGSALLGGVNRTYEGRSDFGVPLLGGMPHVGRGFHNVGIGRQVGTGTFRLGVEVHDFEAMERSLLGPTSAAVIPPSSTAVAPVGGPLSAITGANVGSSGTYSQHKTSSPIASSSFSTAARPAGSVAEAQAQREAEQAAAAEEAQRLFQRAARAESEGNIRLAKVYHEMAARRASGALREEISARLEALAQRGSATVAQHSGSGDP